ncbi:MAG TPA: glycerol-3-phosphate 1-O-acyltransferase PlsY [Thermoanaerobaculia bacterium]|jgi:glycerol-3-phosphate acyltransferase PlsY
MLPVALVALAYLIGSIPFSFLVVKLVSGKDVRDHGSRNVGATNVARTAGKLPGIFALLLDVAKGYAAIAMARYLVQLHAWPFEPGVQPWQSAEFWVAGAGLIAVLAHMFPAWLGFHGGKGVATGFGVVLALDPLVALMVVVVFAIVLLAFRFVSLASILGAAAIPILFSLVPSTPFWWIVMTAGIALAVILKHHENIARLVQGAERRFGRKKDSE